VNTQLGSLQTGMFNQSNRGYPDISLLAHAYQIYLNGEMITVDGTSASTPVMAALTNLINYDRKLQGYPTMGWLNPFLYQYYTEFTNDITIGNNNCSGAFYDTTAQQLSRTCCPEGFYATKGWDPVTGLGSLNFPKFYQTAMSVVSSSSSSSNNTLSTGAIAGIVIGGVVGIALLIALGYYLIVVYPTIAGPSEGNVNEKSVTELSSVVHTSENPLRESNKV